MSAPAVEISVDPGTGVWSTDGLPMLYVPRHFLMGLLRTTYEALGASLAEQRLYAAGYDAAFRWCGMEAAHLGLAGMDVFHFYMKRLSQRGWGLFDGAGINPETGTGVVTLRHSAFVADAGVGAGGKRCGFCAGWAPGALMWVGHTQGRAWNLTGYESRCAAEGHSACELVVTQTGGTAGNMAATSMAK
jgi:predicted hydrocarbon binding protein